MEEASEWLEEEEHADDLGEEMTEEEEEANVPLPVDTKIEEEIDLLVQPMPPPPPQRFRPAVGPLQAHLEYLHGHLLLVEEEWWRKSGALYL